ncbi:hypothetical protein DEB41_10055 [Vibrio anguillarum]|jgi:hypothetical protein|uniref:Uncharacterized protein n=2 Tax=Vibrio TaxID=662 RepID=A0A191W2G3_VIBAN|nr:MULTISPECIES: hypothetical protein [Vibrio]AEH33735.1 hypothetical protein VAA_01115 [Vibrio anguillarum 775]AGU58941.1 hypothetical protein N175_10910 [Vibrio anguillarum M3]AQM20025.1 hypothetical protein PN51_09580 [Vibrio anguillarum]ARV26340.1 hypothetical protein A6A12_0656 [Vibrio anguillarum]ASF91342.1 hypothetical protein CEA93_04645 [Vibrio anguillarum]
MKKSLWIFWIAISALLASSRLYAETEITCSLYKNHKVATDTIRASLEQADDAIISLQALMKLCPSMALEMADLASTLHPQLALDIFNTVFDHISSDQVAALTAILVKNAPQEMRSEVIQLAVTKSPESAQAIVDAVIAMDLMDSTDVIVAAISGGADPATITEPTAAGTPSALPGGLPPVATVPGNTTTLGTGNGSGGGTASPN